MRDHSSHKEVDRKTAVNLLLEQCHPVERVETIPVQDCVGRILAQDAIAQLDMPNCLTCCMDSVAVHWDDFKDGMPDTTGWQRGDQWQFANTGIGMPEGFDTAIVIEHVILSDDLQTISFDAAPSAQFAGTKPKGSRMHQGDVLVPANTKVTPLLASLIASGNNQTVQVQEKVRVAFIPTGCELVAVGSEVPRGKNIETNSILAAGKIAGWDAEPVVWDTVPDDPALIRQAVVDAAASCDVVVLNAGSSKGSDDWNVEMLEEVGQVLYHETNHGPGHHSSGSVVDGTPVVGISGPPGGAAFTMDFYLYPVVRALQGQDTNLKTLTVRLKEDFPGKGKAMGKGMGAKEATATSAPKGEERPSIVADHRTFYSIQQMKLEQDEQGQYWALRASSTHPGVAEADALDCYYALDKDNAPAQGDLITVDLRP